MFGDPGLSALSFQLETYRWGDHFRRMRERREAAYEQSEADFWLAQYNQLVDRYNALLHAYNQVAAAGQASEQRAWEQDQSIQQQNKVIRARDAKIDHLENLLEQRDAEEKLRWDRHYASLRRAQNPDEG